MSSHSDPADSSTAPAGLPPAARARFEQARAWLDAGQAEAAVAPLVDLLDSHPGWPGSYPLLATALERLGQRDQAAEVLFAATQRFPDDWHPYACLGGLLAGAGDWAGAESCFAIASQLEPAQASLPYNRGVALRELGRDADAIAALEHAITLQPRHADAYHALGLSYKRLQQAEAALLAFQCAAGIAPADPRPRLEQALVLRALGRLPEALATLEAMDATCPPDPEVHNLRGVVLRQLGRAEPALAAYTQALQLRPGFADALNNRANLLLLNRRFSAALADFDALMALQPERPWLPGLRLYTALHLFDWQHFEPRRQALLADVATGRRGVQPLVLQCLSDDPQAQQAAARIWMESLPGPVQTDSTAAPTPSARKITLAYISRDFREHPVSYLVAEVLELHDRERFQVLALNYGPVRPDDAMQARLRAGVDRFLDVAELDDAQVAALCRQLGVDIAVDLTGFTEGGRSGIFARRAAPVQVLYLGYLGSSGTTLHDYLVADPVLVTDSTRPHYTEKLLRLPHYQANDRRRPRPTASPTRASLGLPENALVLACFNNPCKISPDTFAAWVRILQALPQAVLWTLDEDPQAAEQLRRHAQAAGVAPQRLVFAGRTDRHGYLARLRVADLFLDTWPYNAGTTASDALWMGLPVLTRRGQSFPGRMAASVLQAAGLPQLVAEDTDGYVRQAIALGQEPQVLATLRATLDRQQASCALFDTPRFTRQLEQAFQAAHARRASGLAAADIDVAAEGGAAQATAPVSSSLGPKNS